MGTSNHNMAPILHARTMKLGTFWRLADEPSPVSRASHGRPCSASFIWNFYILTKAIFSFLCCFDCSFSPEILSSSIILVLCVRTTESDFLKLIVSQHQRLKNYKRWFQRFYPSQQGLCLILHSNQWFALISWRSHSFVGILIS